MVERIRQILQTRQLSPTQFADALGLARPIISHILSGRNKPSLEVVQKIIAAFPDLSLPWLLSGQGPMVAASVVPAPVAATATATPAADIAAGKAPQRATKRVVRSVEPEAAPVVSTPAVPVPQPAPVEVPPIAPAPAPAPVQVEAPPAVAPTPAAPANPSYSAVVTTPQNAPQVSAAPTTAAAPDMLAAFAEPGKTIRRIVIFYNDGTFSAYQPEVS